MTEERRQHPTRIDHFRIERVICERDDTIVYRAFDEKENRASAVKVSNGLRDSSSKAREAWFAGDLEHPSILNFHGRGTIDGNEYIASEFADGGSLDGFLIQVRSSIPQGVKVSARLKGEYIMSMIQRFHDLALALDRIHSSDYEHGNIKPSNIAICTNRNQFKLFDIGRSRDAANPNETEVELIGFIAPELIPDDGRPLDGKRVDVYSLGMILYNALTLTFPFDTSDSKRYLSSALASRPVPVASVNPSLPTNLERVIMKAIAREPSDRYPSGRELAEELQRVLTDQEVEAPDVPPGDRIVAGLKLHWRVTLFILLVIAIAGLIIFRDYLY